jgi:organic radical activating enzyme
MWSHTPPPRKTTAFSTTEYVAANVEVSRADRCSPIRVGHHFGEGSYMHLVDILSLRQVPAAGLYLALTRRCPLSCAHCSTNSSLASEEHAASTFVRLIESFTPTCRPEVVVLTGGEPLVRPALVREITERAHAVGTRVVLASGMFFARQPIVPRLLDETIRTVDHLTASLDIYHEQQVARTDVFRVMHAVLDRGQGASFCVVGLTEQDPYLTDVTESIRREFDDRIPIVVNLVGAVGRAREWLAESPYEVGLPPTVDPVPCDMATWPVVSYDGTVVACCNQEAIDGPTPAHLRVGQAGTDDWATLRQRYADSATLRAIRTFGPLYVAERYTQGAVTCDGYCSTCLHLSDAPRLSESVEPFMNRPAMRIFEDQVTLLQQQRFVDRHAPPSFVHLARLGADRVVA